MREGIDAAVIQRTYTAVLSAGPLPTGEALDKTTAVLVEHIGLLVAEVSSLAVVMRRAYRRSACHVVVRARHILEEPAGPSQAARQRHAFDLALIARSLLILAEQPGPMGSAVDAEEVERVVQRRICGACLQPVEIGEGAEPVVFAAEASGGIRGYLHTDSCVVVAEERRSRLRAVP
ncbi:DUF6415 family natural product biosynthesis protein [Streptomyces sp. NPDC000658]|uniref:DUF6415 family natural product biosynthesis protein n=1 Tax=Streptomyces sp. NPDC000658 TaxID=3154266 RepID=UPI00332AD442